MSSEDGATPLFVDTGAWYAVFAEDDTHHARAARVHEAIRTGALAYRPIYTTAHVLSELVTLVLSRASYDVAARALQQIRHSPNVHVIHPDRLAFDAAAEQFNRYDDQDITLVDHLTGVLADERDVEHIFAFDDDFRTLEFTLVPGDTGAPAPDE